MTRTRWIDESRLTITGDRATARREDQESQASKPVGRPQQVLDASRSKMNKLESRYAQYLEALKFGKEIRDWRYEPFKLKLAEKCTYCPDFFIVTKDGAFECHETKGWLREDSWIKLKVAAREFPWWQFKLITWGQGQWEVKYL